jgi:hypothetical protein
MGSQKSDRGTRIARWSGLSAGLVVVIVALYAWRVPPSQGPAPGASVMFVAGPTGELEVSPTGRFLAGTDLRPAGRVITGALAIRNQTGRNLDVRLRALPNLDDLDHLLQVEVSGSEGVLFRGDLGGLRSWTDPLRIGRGREQSLSFRAWLVPQAPSGYEGDDASVTMEFLSTPVSG